MPVPTSSPAPRSDRRRTQAGFSFIEILVVMAIIATLVGAVAVVVPKVLESQRKTKSINNVRNMLDFFVSNSVEKGWPPYSGKNFVLSLIAHNQINISNPDNLETFFSPGDRTFELKTTNTERYKEINKKSLENGDFHELTSYAGRRNREKEFKITPQDEEVGTPIISDDDQGNVHHPSGLIIGRSNRSVKLVEWEDLGMAPPSDMKNPEPFLGDSATSDLLRPLAD